MTGEAVVERSRGPAHDFHHRIPALVDGRRTIWIHEVDRPSLVLGSSQRDDVLHTEAARAAGYEVTGRRSGGGLVLVEPEESCWVDVLIGRDDPHWSDDVNRAFGWVGDAWRRALESLGVGGLSVHRGPLVDRAHGRMLCFAGLGPGEVTATVGARSWKVVGLSQRRTRDVARFQGLYVRRWNPGPLVEFVDSWPDGLDPRQVAAGVPPGFAAPAPGAVADATVSALSDDADRGR